MVPETPYWLVMYGDGNPDPTNIAWAHDGGGGGYTRGIHVYDSGGGWGAQATDVLFRTYYNETLVYLGSETREKLLPIRIKGHSGWENVKEVNYHHITLGTLVDQGNTYMGNMDYGEPKYTMGDPLAQMFIPTVASISKVEYYMKTGSSTGDVYDVMICEDSGGLPGSVLLSSSVPGSRIPVGNPDWVSCWFDGGDNVFVLDGRSYWIVLDRVGTEHIHTFYYDLDMSYGSGYAVEYNSGWGGSEGYDWLFRTYYNDTEGSPYQFSEKGKVLDNVGDMWTAHGQRKMVRTSNRDLYIVISNTTSSGRRQILLYRSTDDGQTWASPTGIPGDQLVSEDMDGRQSYEPAIAVDQWNTLHIVWRQDDHTQAENIVHYRAFNTSMNSYMGTPVNISVTTKSLSDAVNSPVIDVDSTGLVAVAWWRTDSAGDMYDHIYMNTRLPDGSWIGESKITLDPVSSQSCSISFDSKDYLHMVYTLAPGAPDYKIYYMNITEGVPMSVTTSELDSSNPCMVIDNEDFIHVVWETAHQSWSDYGVNYTGFPAITGPTVPDSGTRIDPADQEYSSPSLAMDNENKLVVFMLGADGDIYSMKGVPGSIASWDSSLTAVTSDGSNSYVTTKWSMYNNHMKNGRVDFAFKGAGNDIFTQWIDLDPGPGDWNMSWIPPLDNGYFTNGSNVNETFVVNWWVDIPLGTPEGTYVGTITYIIEATDEVIP